MQVPYFLGVDMHFRTLALVGLAILTGACATMMAEPADDVSIVGSAEKVIWTYRESLPSNDPATIKAHLQKYEQALSLPVSLKVEPGKYLYVVPVCNGVIQWDKGSLKSVLKDTMTVTVDC